MSKFSLLDTPEYDIIVNNMKSVGKFLEMADINIIAYDAKSGLVFEFYEVEDAIEVDNKLFIIFENTRDEVIIHTHKNNFLLLIKIIVNFCSFRKMTNGLIETIIRNSAKLLQKDIPSELVNMIADLLCEDSTEYIKCPIGEVDITINDLHQMSRIAK